MTFQNLSLVLAGFTGAAVLFVLAAATHGAVRAWFRHLIDVRVGQVELRFDVLARDFAAQANTASTVAAHAAALRILQEHDEQNTVRFKALSKAVDDAVECAEAVARDVRAAGADARSQNKDLVQELVDEVRMLGEELARMKPGPMTVDQELEAARERGRTLFPVAAEVNVGAFGTSPLERPASIHRVVNPTPVAIDAAAQEDQELAAIARLDGSQKHLRLLVLSAKKSCGPEACCKCVYWDQDEGQSSIQQLPVFASAARYVLPNRMGTPVLVDENGDKLADELQPPPMLPAKLNKWELFGACSEDNAVHHAIDKCPSFKPIARAFAGQEVRA